MRRHRALALGSFTSMPSRASSASLALSAEVRLSLSASELAGFDLFGAPSLKPMPDHWPMPAGFDLRSFFLVGGDA